MAQSSFFDIQIPETEQERLQEWLQRFFDMIQSMLVHNAVTVTMAEACGESRSPWPGTEPEIPVEIKTYEVPIRGERALHAAPGALDVFTVTEFKDGTVMMEAVEAGIRLIRKGRFGPYTFADAA